MTNLQEADLNQISEAAQHRIHVIMACHNRRALTTRAVNLASEASAAANAELSITLFDDGSTDGTAQSLESVETPIQIIRGSGSAYWAQGMSRAEAHVLSNAEVKIDDILVWLNDDVALDNTAFSAILDRHEKSPGSVLVGAMRDPDSGRVTYSGMRRGGLHPLRFDSVEPSNEVQEVQTFNGNLVAMSVTVARQLGGIDGGFSHALADIDYGLRCGRASIPVLLLPGTHGTCPRNALPQPESVRRAWRRFTGTKGGGNFASLRRILRKSNPCTWWFFIGASYFKWWIKVPMTAFRRM